MNLLNLIPQCHAEINNNNPNIINWYFNPTSKTLGYVDEKKRDNTIKQPKLVEQSFIDELKEKVKQLPVRKDKVFTPQELETRKNYPRAYDYWSKKEKELLIMARKKIDSVDVLAEIFKRQPSIIRQKYL